MSDTGWKSPSGYEEETLWNNTTNAYTDDSNYAYGIHNDIYNGYVSIKIGDASSSLRELDFPIGADGDEDYVYTGEASDLWHKTFISVSEARNLKVRIETALPAGATYTGFNFDIPDGSIINGIEVRIKGVLGSMDFYCYHVAAKVYYTRESTPVVGQKYPLPAFRRS